MERDDEDQVGALHLAARRWCVDRHARWCAEYERMQAKRPATFAKTTIEDDRQVFPRYLVLEALLAAVERWVPDELGTIAEARERLVAAARAAQGPMTAVDHLLAREAMDEERDQFVQFARESMPADWAQAESLPFRRVLAADELAGLDRTFTARWGGWSGGVADRRDLPVHLTLHDEVWRHLPVIEALEDFLAARQVDRLFELREGGYGHEIATDAATFAYEGREGRWSVAGCSWMIYASRASSITFGGDALLAFLRSRLPGLDVFAYRGADDPPSARPGFVAPRRPRS